MEEDTVLILYPARIDGDTAVRHGVEVIGHRADIVRIPPDKCIVRDGIRKDILIIIAVSVVAVEVLTVRNIRDCIDQRRTVVHFLQQLAAAVILRTVEEVDVIYLARIVEVDRSSSSTGSLAGNIISEVAIIISIRRIYTKLIETVEIYIVFNRNAIVICIDRIIQYKRLVVESNGIRVIGKCLDVVVHRFCTGSTGIQTERDITGRHGINIYHDLIPTDSIRLRLPTFTVVVCHAVGSDDREVLRDILLIQSFNSLDRLPRLIVASSIYGAGIYCTVITVARSERAVIPIYTCLLSINITVLRGIVIIITGRYRVCVILDLEFQRILRTIEEHVDNRGAVRRDHFAFGILVVGFIMEAGTRAVGLGAALAAGDSYHAGGGVYTDRGRCYQGRCVLYANGVCKVIYLLAVFVHANNVLPPDNDGIVRLRVRDPAGIYGCSLRQFMTEFKLRTAFGCVGFVLTLKPAAEIKAVALHGRIVCVALRVIQLRILGDFTGLDKARCFIGSAVAVLIEDQPNALRRMNAEYNVALDLNVSTVRIELTFRVFLNVAAAVVDEPALEVMGGVSLRRHVDRIRLIF